MIDIMAAEEKKGKFLQHTRHRTKCNINNLLFIFVSPASREKIEKDTRLVCRAFAKWQML